MTKKSTKPSWTELRQQYRRFKQYASPDRRYFALDIVSIVIAVITNAAMIWLMGRPLSLIQSGDYDALPAVLGLFAIVLLVNQAMQMGGGWLTNWLSLRFIGRVRNAIMYRYLFVKRIKDIDYPDVITKAVKDYLFAIKTVGDEFKSYSVPPERTRQYSQDVVAEFNIYHKRASRNCTDVIRDSQNLYDDVTLSEPSLFQEFSSTPKEFRNGLLHAEMDNEDENLKWRLDENE